MLQFGRIFVNTVRRSFQIAMESKSKLNRKRKLSSSSKDVMVIETRGTKRRTTGKNSGVTREEREANNGLNNKSVLLVENGKQKSCLLFLAHKQTIAIQGKVKIQALKGTVDILGFKVKPNSQTYKVFSPSSMSLLTIRECKQETDCDDKLDSRLKLSDILSTSNAKLKKIAQARADKASSVLLMDGLQAVESDFICQYKEYEDIFTKEYQEEDGKSSEKLIHEVTSTCGFTLLEADDRYATYSQPQEWEDIITDFKELLTQTGDGHKNQAILICGGKGVGKSTFARTVINSLLNSCGEVCYLECDVGQTELTPPTILSLNRVFRPLLGPPFTHLQWPERAFFYGDVSPKDNPDLYINSIASLYNHYQEEMACRPLVINTQGWVKGFGVPLLMDVMRITNPTQIVQINSTQATKNLPNITREFLDTSPGWVWPGQKSKQKVGDLIENLRKDDGPKDVDVSDLHHQSYPTMYQIDACIQDHDHKPSLILRPADYRTMSTLAYFSHALQTPQVDSLTYCKPYRVPWSNVAVHVNHTMVPRSQLLVSLNASIVGLAVSPSSVLDEHNTESGLPMFIKETPIIECVGLGIVRNIDPINRLFYILTPVPLEKLERVNTLLKGNLEIPAPLLLKNGGPYVSSEFSYDIKGAGARKVRYNLQRKKFNSPARPDL